MGKRATETNDTEGNIYTLKRFTVRDGRYRREVKEKLIQEHGCKCGYCGGTFFGAEGVVLDNYYPRSLFPEKEGDYDNYVLACRNCNTIKGAKIPVDENGKKLILHPYKDDYSEHMHIDDKGYLIADTPEGESTINLMQLNRSEMDVVFRSVDPMWNAFRVENDNPLKDYEASIKNIKKLLTVADGIKDKELRHYSYRMIYGNVISAMEAFLAFTIVKLLRFNTDLKWRFVENYEWGNQHFSLSNLRTEYEEIDTRIINTLSSQVMYHNLQQMYGLFRSTLGLDIISHDDFGVLIKAVINRHDIVHRNGKPSANKTGNKAGKELVIEKKDVLDLIKIVDRMVARVANQIVFFDYQYVPVHEKAFSYILECNDGSLFCGSTDSLKHCMEVHNGGKGSAYTKARLPVTLVYFEKFGSIPEAESRCEAIKKMSKARKNKLIKESCFNGLKLSFDQPGSEGEIL